MIENPDDDDFCPACAFSGQDDDMWRFYGCPPCLCEKKPREE